MFGYVHRLMREESLIADIIFQVTPSLQKSKSATFNKEGTVARGGHEIQAGARFAKETDTYGLMFTIQGAQTLKIERENAETGEKVTQDPLFVPGATLTGQFKAAPQFALSLELTYKHMGETTKSRS